MMKQRQGKQHGKGLKGGLNMADTGSVVGTVKGSAGFGKMRTPSEKSRSMIAGNASKRSNPK